MPSKGILPQNIQTLIGEIGERQVLLQLSLPCRGTKWRVYLSPGEPGYGVLLRNQETQSEVLIQVKTLQRLHRLSPVADIVGSLLSNEEYFASDFLIGYWLEDNSFYIVPKQDLRKAHSGERVVWRFSFTVKAKAEAQSALARYRDAWQLIDPALDKITSDS